MHRAGHWIFEAPGSGYGDVLGAGATVVGYECDGCVFTYRDGLPYPTGEDGTPSTFEILGTCPTQHFTRETAPRPPKPGEPSELEYIASRVFGTRETRGDGAHPPRPRRARHLHERRRRDRGDLGVDRLGSRSGGSGSADRADHPERVDPAWGSPPSSDGPDVLRFGTLATLGQVELDLLAVFEALVSLAHDVGEVDEDVLLARWRA